MSWSLENGELSVTWREFGSPPIARSKRTGQGLVSIDRLAKAAGGGSVTEFNEESVVHKIRTPLAERRAAASANLNEGGIMGEWHAKPTKDCCSDLLDDECSNFRCGDNCGVECVRTARQCLHLDTSRGRCEPNSSGACRVVYRTASASTLRSATPRPKQGPRGLRGDSEVARPHAQRNSARERDRVLNVASLIY